MSKAFTRESDDAPELPDVPRLRPPLPAGVKNYITPDGERRLQEELDRLIQLEQATVASDDDAALRERRTIAARAGQLRQILASVVVVPPPAAPDGAVRFGAVVTVRERDGGDSVYRIVGVDEMNADHGWVSWLSPLAKSLLNKKPGQRVRLRLPSGDEELEIVRVEYE